MYIGECKKETKAKMRGFIWKREDLGRPRGNGTFTRGSDRGLAYPGLLWAALSGLSVCGVPKMQLRRKLNPKLHPAVSLFILLP